MTNRGLKAEGRRESFCVDTVIVTLISNAICHKKGLAVNPYQSGSARK